MKTETRPAPGARILIIDDNVGLCYNLHNIFEDEGHRVTIAHTGADGLAALREGPIHVTMLDIRLPDVLGPDMLPAIHEMQPDIPVIVMTAHASLETAIQALRLGAYAYVLKPLDMDEVLVTVRRAIEKLHLMEQDRRLTGQLHALNRAALTMTSELKLDRVLQSIADLAQDLVGATYAALGLPGEDGSIAQLYTAGLTEEERIATGCLPQGRGVLGYILRQAESLRLDDLHQHPQSVGFPPHHPDMTNFLGAPIVSRERVLGGLYLTDKVLAGAIEPFTEKDQQIIDILAAQAAVAIENARLYEAERQRAEQMRHMALHDELTNLPNRTLFAQHLERSVQRAKKDLNFLFAVLFLDLDRLKVINDSLGHPAGDQLLITIARRLETCMRPGDTVARFGGDEFGVLLDDIQDIDEATHIADRIQEEISSPVNLEGQVAFTTASIGIASNVIAGYDGPENVLRDADTAMYRAKAMGKACYALFDIGMYTQAVIRYQSEADLRQALERQEFRIHYQPFVSLINGQIVGAEALLRWRHPERGFIAPEEFIPLAEETGLIEPIGQWVLQTVCTQAKAWHTVGHSHLRVSVNVSARQFQSPNLAESVKQALDETDLTPQALELEVTESITVRNDGLATLNELSDLGVQVSLDDFGLGSSLDCLKRLPLDTLKIDQSFVSSIPGDASNEAIVTAIITMAHSLKLRVIAEGVETKEQLAFLRAKWCDEVQGDLFGPAVLADELTKQLHVRRDM